MTRRFTSPLEPAEAERFGFTVANLRTLLKASADAIPIGLDQPKSGSAVANAYAGNLRDGYEQARLAIVSADDHLGTILAVLDSRLLPTQALYSLLRPAAEAVVHSAFLLDPSINEMQRLARGLTARLENLIEQDKIDPQPVHLEARIASLVTKARRSGIRVLVGRKRSEVLSFGEPRRNEVELFARYVPEGAAMYRYLSGHVHVMAWVKFAGASRATRTEEPGISSLPIEFDFLLFADMLTLVLQVYQANVVQIISLSGHPPNVWTDAKTRALRSAGQSQELFTALSRRISRAFVPTGGALIWLIIGVAMTLLATEICRGPSLPR